MDLFKKEYKFVSLEKLACDIVKSFNNGDKDIHFVLTVDEVPDFLTAFLSTGKFRPVSIDWATPDINGYNREYYFSFNGNEIFIEPVYRENRFIGIGNDSIAFISEGIKIGTYEKFKKKYGDVILFDIEH